MKRLVCLFVFITLTVQSAFANPGDTTWVQAQSDIWLGAQPANFDSTVTFPDGSTSYRRIYMIFTMGKYQCPGSPQYCSDWDYTVQNFLMTPNGDTIELGRLISPYGNSARMPATWKQRYIYDVTDYYPLLRNSATVRIHYSGWSGGFTGDIKFAFIEGTPPRNVLGIERLWHGSFQYGGSSPIDDKVTAFNKTSPANTLTAEMKFNISGHGSDGTSQCAEFCKKYYQVKVNGSQTAQKDIWRDDCGSNHLYPQNGTWIFDRGNWCPGDLIHTNTHVLNGVGSSSTYDVDVDFEAYTGSGSLGSYIIDANVIYYGGFNRSVDASLEDIIAPTNHELHFRENPATANPVVKVKNMGSTAITSLELEYHVVGKPAQHFTWNGNIPSLSETIIKLPELWDLRVLTGDHNFTCKILKVNGQADEDNSNNSLQSTFTAAPQWHSSIVITLNTNGSSINGVSETNWYIVTGNDTVARRVNNATKTLYRDTIHLGPAAYRFIVQDAGCDGIAWWFYSQYNPNPGNGSILVRKLGAPVSYTPSGYFAGDFGCGFTQYFNVNWPSDIPVVQKTDAMIMSLFPNPAGESVTVSFEGENEVDGMISVVDALGRQVMVQKAVSPNEKLDVSRLNNGVYSVVYANEGYRLQSRLVIAR
jgi:hypothetical protein